MQFPYIEITCEYTRRRGKKAIIQICWVTEGRDLPWLEEALLGQARMGQGCHCSGYSQESRIPASQHGAAGGPPGIWTGLLRGMVAGTPGRVETAASGLKLQQGGAAGLSWPPFLSSRSCEGLGPTRQWLSDVSAGSWGMGKTVVSRRLISAESDSWAGYCYCLCGLRMALSLKQETKKLCTMLVAVNLHTQKVLKTEKHASDLWKTHGFTSLGTALEQLKWESEGEGFLDPALT